MMIAMHSMMATKNSTLFTTAVRMFSKYTSVGTVTLTAPARSPISQPSFAYPVGSISPAGVPWHSTQCSVTFMADT